MEKKRFSLVILVTVCCMLFASHKVFADTNLVKNWDFEQGEAGWTSRNKGEISSKVSYGNGKYSGVVPATAITNNKASGYIGQVIDVKPNTTYTVLAYAKTDTEGAIGYFTARWFDNNTQGELVKNSSGAAVDQNVNTTRWKKYTFTFHSGNHRKVLLQLVKWSDDERTKKSNIYIDNVEMKAQSNQQSYKEIWRDDFDGTELDKTNWGYELGSIRGFEQQHYVRSKENVFLRDGNLILRATNRAPEDQYANPRNKSRKVIYNSGSVRTHGKKEFLYGRLEVRAKLPKGQGVFPAFWTLGSDFTLDGKIHSAQGHGWPSTGEIDIMELVGEQNPLSRGNRTVYQTLHYGQREKDNGKFAGNGTAYSLPNGTFNDDYHTFAIDWYKDHIDWLVDNKVVRSVRYSDDETARKILNKPQFAQLNLAMGGAWPGPVGQNLAGTEFAIDYVSYSRNAEQEKQAQEYYANAPKLNGVRNVTISKGQIPDLLKGITATPGYQVDYSIDNEQSFQDKGGNTSVDLLVKGQAEKNKIAQLKPGVYNIHYSAYSSNMTYESKVARKTVTLTITE